MTSPSQRYAAFISYRHMPRDRRWASRLMKVLETYHTPKALRREAYPDRIGHLFRDEDEIPASSDLSDQIKDALAHSDHLIVVCSPDTPGSMWVRREIELFQEMGKGERIIPLLIAGEPDESFPPELRRRRVTTTRPDGGEDVQWIEIEPIAADVRPRGDESTRRTERRALLRVAAALLGCRYDDLARRDDERRRAVFLRWAASATGAAIAASMTGLWIWDSQYRIKTQYCANYSEHWGVPSCVGPLSADVWKRRYQSYRIRSQGGRVLEMTWVNGSDTPVADRLNFTTEPWAKGVARWLYSYQEKRKGGQLSNVVMEGPTGLEIRTVWYVFSHDFSKASASFDQELEHERQSAFGSALGLENQTTPTQDSRSAIVQHRLIFDDQGLLIRRDFLPAEGHKTVADGEGAYGRSYAYTDNGLARETRNLDSLGEVSIAKSGVASQINDYDNRGDIVDQRWLTISSHLWSTPAGYARVHARLNEYGNEIETTYFGQNNEPTFTNTQGAIKATFKYDERGNPIEVAWFGFNDNPILTKDQGIAKVTAKYDERGNEIEWAWFGIDGAPVLTKDGGVAKTAVKYDERGNLIEAAWFGVDGEPVLTKDEGVAKFTVKYDERGNQIEWAWFGIDGTPILTKDQGTARSTAKYDERGNQIEQAWFDLNGHPIPTKDRGIAKFTATYDERGNQVERAWFGIDDNPILTKDEGAAKLTTTYDERGNQIEQAWFGIDGKPILTKDQGIAKFTAKYDERGNQIEWAWFSIDGTPILTKDQGAAQSTASYDERGNPIEMAWFGINGKPILTKDEGAAKRTARYDRRGNQIEQAWFGIDGQPILTKDQGAAKSTAKYDERGNRIELAYFGIDDQPILKRDWGIARWTIGYDARGNQIEEAYYGVDGKPILRLDIGAAKGTARYDELGKMIEVAAYGINGQLVMRSDWGVAKQTMRYDERGNEIERAYWGVDEQPVLTVDTGIAKWTARYDEHDNQVELAYFDIAGQPVLAKDTGIAKWTKRFDQRGNEIEVAFWGVDGKPTPQKDTAITLIETSYDEDGSFVAKAYDENRRPSLTAYFDKENRSTVSSINQYATRIQLYDDRGELTEVRFFDERDQPLTYAVQIKTASNNSLAAHAGLRPKDSVLTYNGVKINSLEQLGDLIADTPRMAPCVLEVRRDGSVKTISVAPGIMDKTFLDDIDSTQSTEQR